jgi:Ca2+-binding EF-hand superfamily protein
LQQAIRPKLQDFEKRLLMLDRQHTGVMKPLELRNVLTAHLGIKLATTGNFSIVCALLDHGTMGLVQYREFIDAIATDFADGPVSCSGHHGHNTSALLELAGYTKTLERFAAKGADWLNSCGVLDQKSMMSLPLATAHTVCTNVGVHITQDQLSQILAQVGQSTSDVRYVKVYEELVRFTTASKVQLTRAAALVERLVASLMENRCEILPALQKMDSNHNGFLDSNELRGAMNDLKVKLSKEDTDGVVRLFDKSGDGKLDYAELSRILARKRHDVQTLLDRILHATNGIKGGLLVALEKMDQNGNGHISSHELVRGMADLNVKLSTAEGEGLVNVFDTNSDGKLDYSELSRALNARRSEVRAKCDEVLDRILLQMKEGHSGVVQTLRKFDKDGSGSLDAKELCKGMTELNIKLTKVDAEVIIRALDKSGGSSLDYEEFSRALNHRRAETADKLAANYTAKKPKHTADSVNQIDTRASMADSVMDRMLAHNGVLPALKRADRNGNGFISADEFVKSMATLHIKLSSADAGEWGCLLSFPDRTSSS